MRGWWKNPAGSPGAHDERGEREREAEMSERKVEERKAGRGDAAGRGGHSASPGRPRDNSQLPASNSQCTVRRSPTNPLGVPASACPVDAPGHALARSRRSARVESCARRRRGWELTCLALSVQCCIGSLGSVSVPRREVTTIWPTAPFEASANS